MQEHSSGAAGIRSDDQLSLPLPGADDRRLATRRLWIVAADARLLLSDRHYYFLLDSTLGTSAVDPTDLLLVRASDGTFILIAPHSSSEPADAFDAIRADLAARIAFACTQPGSRSHIQELIAISSKPARVHNRTPGAQHRRDGARTDLEEALFRLSMMPWGGGRPEVLSALARKLAPTTHPFVRSLICREHADASVATYHRTFDDMHAYEALSSYQHALRDLDTIRMRHQTRVTRHNAAHAAAVLQPALPGLDREDGVPAMPAISFSVDRLCGFWISIDHLPASDHAPSLPLCYRSLGPVALNDKSLIQALSGLRSPHRRIVAAACRANENVSIRAGVFDEMRALLRLDLDNPAHEDVAALRVVSDTISFEDMPWVFDPSGPVDFCGRITRRGRHQISVRATLRRGHNIHLDFILDRNATTLRYFS